MPNDDAKPQYFSNDDFEKVAADIISSPRRLKQSPSDPMESLFVINQKQQEYYTKCFRHLMKTTQGKTELNGALCGADERIVAFFKRSKLDVNSLSKIWSLADVNEDGWLDLSEFSIAMHLVVLRVKGEIPVPDALPKFAQPPVTPPRNCQSYPETNFNSLLVSPDTNTNFTRNAAPSSPKMDSQPPIKEFCDTPPLLVDGRPTAIKHSALMALKSPSGPPPVPPSRPNQRGHNRSASLDLKLIAINNGRVNDGVAPLIPPSSLALWSTTTDTDSNVPTFNSTPRSQQPSVSTTTTFASFPGTPDSLLVPNVVPPPIPQRVSPSPLPSPVVIAPSIPVKCLKIDAETQTTEKIYGEIEIQKFFEEFDSKLENLIGEENEASEGNGLDRWSKRCIALRAQNAELETERARLAQVRIQLELRLQEIEDRAKLSSSSTL